MGSTFKASTTISPPCGQGVLKGRAMIRPYPKHDLLVLGLTTLIYLNTCYSLNSCIAYCIDLVQAGKSSTQLVRVCNRDLYLVGYILGCSYLYTSS